MSTQEASNWPQDPTPDPDLTPHDDSGDEVGSSGGVAGGADELGSRVGGRAGGWSAEDALDSIDAPLRRRTRRARTTPPSAPRRHHFTPRQRFLILDSWMRSKLPAKDSNRGVMGLRSVRGLRG